MLSYINPQYGRRAQKIRRIEEKDRSEELQIKTEGQSKREGEREQWSLPRICAMHFVHVLDTDEL